MIDKSEFELIDYTLDESTFMGGWMTNHSVIDDMWSYYKKNEDSHITGQTYNPVKDVAEKGVDKISTELSCSSKANHYPVKKYIQLLDNCINYYSQKYHAVNFLNGFSIVEDFNIQYYKPNEGFPKWHDERGCIQNSNRVFVFMTYLNDVEDGGTAFLYQNLKIPAKKGLTLIWPSEWTHTHRGIISETNDKMIVTGWYSFLGKDK